MFCENLVIYLQVLMASISARQSQKNMADVTVDLT